MPYICVILKFIKYKIYKNKYCIEDKIITNNSYCPNHFRCFSGSLSHRK